MRKPALTAEQLDHLRLALTTGDDVALDADSITLSLLDAGGTPAPIGRAERRGLLERLRAGERLELGAEVVGFLQRETPNRNFVRFRAGILPSFSTSFRGVPFLRNHDGRDIAARGGKVVDTTFEHRDDGTKAIRFRLHLVKDWAVEGFLDGTIDRFSIGWARTGPVLCSLDDKPLWGPGCCSHWPGDVVEGRVCEVLYTGAEGTELSAVNVPAVVGTGIESVRQLKAEFDGTGLLHAILGAHLPEIAPMDLTAIITALGLPAGATVEQAAERSRTVIAELAAARSDAELARARLGQAEQQLVELTARATAAEASNRQQQVDAAIARLYASRKLQVVVGGQNPVEAHLRQLAASDIDLFGARCQEILAGPDVRPGGDPPPPDPTGAGAGGDGGRGSEDLARQWLRKAGLSAADVEKYAKRHLDNLAGR